MIQEGASPDFGADTSAVQQALAHGNYVQALALCDQLVESSSENPLFHYLRGVCLLNMQQFPAALEEARQVIKTDPRVHFGYQLLFQAAWRLGRKLEAQTAIETAMNLSNRQSDVLVDYALFMSHERGPKIALSIAEEATVAAPQNADAWTALGIAQLRLHQINESIESFQKALQQDPNHVMSKYYLAHLLARKGQDAKASALVNLMTDNPVAAGMAKGLADGLTERNLRRRLLESEETANRLLGNTGPIHRMEVARTIFGSLVIVGVVAAVIWMTIYHGNPFILLLFAPLFLMHWYRWKN